MVHELSSKLYYHGLHHTFDVYDAATKLAIAEQVCEHDLLLLQTAAIYHDAGFIEQYAHNEHLAVSLAQEALPKYGYSNDDITTISSIIMTTNMQQAPQTLLEKIIRDADLDYLGRPDFPVLSALLRKEWNCYGSSYTDKEWFAMQITFLEKHTYFTNSAITQNEAGKQHNLQQVKALALLNEKTNMK